MWQTFDPFENLVPLEMNLFFSHGKWLNDASSWKMVFYKEEVMEYGRSGFLEGRSAEAIDNGQ